MRVLGFMMWMQNLHRETVGPHHGPSLHILEWQENWQCVRTSCEEASGFRFRTSCEQASGFRICLTWPDVHIILYSMPLRCSNQPPPPLARNCVVDTSRLFFNIFCQQIDDSKPSRHLDLKEFKWPKQNSFNFGCYVNWWSHIFSCQINR